MVNLEKKVVGIDVSSKFLTVSFKNEKDQEMVYNVSNLKTGINGFLKKLKTEEYKIVVEATGSYSSKILHYASSLGFDVYQISPLTIKKYAEVKNVISKTDDEDAKLIRDFGEKMEMSLYKPKKENLEYLDQELNLWQDLEQEKARFSLKLKSLRQKARLNENVIKHYESLIKGIEKNIEKLLKRLPKLEDEELKDNKKLLKSISGIGEKIAENIVAYRSENGAFEDRKQLKKVPRLGEKAYQQAAAFIRIRDGKNPLDNSAVHPEAYPVVEKMAKDLGIKTTELIANTAKIAQIKPENYITEEIGILTLKDILKELEKPGLDPRKVAKIFEFDPNVRSISDLKNGMILPGIVNNITAFGCFVDVGIKESGLVHISQLKEGYVADVNEVVKMHQHVQVKVVEVDEARKRIQLTMII